MRLHIIALASLMLGANWAEAQSYYTPRIYFDVSGGYSHLYINSPPSEPINKDGSFVDFDMAVRVTNAGFPLLIGGGASVSGYFRDERISVADSNNFFFDERLIRTLGFIRWRRGRRRRFGLETIAGFSLRLGWGWDWW